MVLLLQMNRNNNIAFKCIHIRATINCPIQYLMSFEIFNTFASGACPAFRPNQSLNIINHCNFIPNAAATNIQRPNSLDYDFKHITGFFKWNRIWFNSDRCHYIYKTRLVFNIFISITFYDIIKIVNLELYRTAAILVKCDMFISLTCEWHCLVLSTLSCHNLIAIPIVCSSVTWQPMIIASKAMKVFWNLCHKNALNRKF